MFPISDSISARRFPFVNILLIAATVFVFIQQLIFPNQDLFIRTYSLIPSLVDFNDFSTFMPFVTSIFLHGGFLHIISNMWFLWVFGDNVEGHLGFFLFPFLYFLAGIVGNIAQYIIMPNSSIPMLGASGAVAGVLGAYFVLFKDSKIKTMIPFFGFFTTTEIPATFMLGYWFVLQVFSGAVSLPFSSDSGGVAFWAHVGGFLTGLVVAKVIRRFKKEI